MRERQLQPRGRVVDRGCRVDPGPVSPVDLRQLVDRADHVRVFVIGEQRNRVRAGQKPEGAGLVHPAVGPPLWVVEPLQREDRGDRDGRRVGHRSSSRAITSPSSVRTNADTGV
jgi:hypothetical protein